MARATESVGTCSSDAADTGSARLAPQRTLPGVKTGPEGPTGAGAGRAWTPPGSPGRRPGWCQAQQRRLRSHPVPGQIHQATLWRHRIQVQRPEPDTDDLGRAVQRLLHVPARGHRRTLAPPLQVGVPGAVAHLHRQLQDRPLRGCEQAVQRLIQPLRGLVAELGGGADPAPRKWVGAPPRARGRGIPQEGARTPDPAGTGLPAAPRPSR